MANGGIIGPENKTSFGKCKVSTKTSSGNLCTQSGTRTVEVNIVAGGGAGGYNVGGGGGAGGFVRTEVNVSGSTQYPITVGAGGSGSGDVAPRNGGPGSDSSFDTTTATGGGGGAGYNCGSDGLPGGSGGGARGYTSCSPRAGGSGTACQGNDGGSLSAPKGIGGTGAGGGGAGGAGSNSTCVGPPKTGCVAGGAGLAAPINCTTYAAGGKGMGDSSPGSSGSANTGNGGDGGGNPNCAGAGGSGIVIVKELNKASGVWSLSEQLEAKQDGTWPEFFFELKCAAVMVVGGGGAAPSAPSGGGGGAGGMILSPGPITVIGCTKCATVPITIGAGGTGGLSTPRPAEPFAFAGTIGSNTTVTLTGGTPLVGVGGGAGGTPDAFQACNPNYVDVGGSGGGGVGEGNTPGGTNPGGCSTQVSSMPAPLQPLGFGNAGGNGTACGSSPNRQSGGGGGAAEAGDPSSSNMGAGGDGKNVAPLFGTAPQPFYIANGPNAGASAPGTFAGGGGGRQCSNRTPGNGGSGGAGGGGNAQNCARGSGVANTGGGGGAGFGPVASGGVSAYPGGNGGSGIVLIRVPGPNVPSGFAVAPGTNTITTQPCGAKVAAFTVSGTLTIS